VSHLNCIALAGFLRFNHAATVPQSNQKRKLKVKGAHYPNVVFCDGHVESPTLQFLFEDASDEALSRWNRDHQPHREKLSP
jgi:prepilin-type processing-associated H-X9-DG protein